VAAVAAPSFAEKKAPTEPGKIKIKKVKVRAHGTSQSKLGCSPATNGIPCEGLERYRIGMGSTSISYDAKNGSGPVVSYQVMSQQMGGQLASQAIAGLGMRKKIGRGYIQAGPGIARSGVGAGPRSVGIMKTLDKPRLAATGGVGMDVDLKGDEPASLAIDFGTTIDSKNGEEQVYQVGASVMQRF
jgi:hypothetical protein